MTQSFGSKLLTGAFVACFAAIAIAVTVRIIVWMF